MIAITCSSCQHPFAVEEHLAGSKVSCPGCGQWTGVPVAVAAGATESTDQRRPAPNPDLPTTAPPPYVSVSPLHSASGSADATVGAAPDVGSDGYLTDFLTPPQAADELGRLGNYRILKILGHGGMGVVYQAEDLKLKRTVALKAMLPALAASASSGKRFLREAEAMAAVEHDHIVRIYQIDEERKVPFLAMEFLKGESLHDRLKRDEPMPLTEVLRIGREIAEGLAAAHATGLIHRDIKPGNIWLEAPRSRVKILDFGLARVVSQEASLTHQGAIIGTPAYMAPEQGRGGKVDARSDLFSLGVVLYRLSTGAQPFCGPDAVSTLLAVATHEPPPAAEQNANLPQGLSDLVMRLLKKEPSQRPASAAEVIQTLQGIEKELDGDQEAAAAPREKSSSPAQPPRAATSGPVAVVRTAAPPHSESEEMRAPEEMSLLGMAVARTVRILRLRWKLSLVALAVAACAGYLYAKNSFTSRYALQARLIYRPAPERPDIPASKNIQAIADELKKAEYYEQLNEQFDMGIPPALFVRFFYFTELPEAASIRVALTWPDNAQGAKIVNALIAMHCKAVADARKAELAMARKRLSANLKVSGEELEKARKASLTFLSARKFTGNAPQKRLDELRSSMAVAETNVRSVRLQYKDTDREIERLEAQMAKTKQEIDKQKLPPEVARLQTLLGELGSELKTLRKAQLKEKRNVALAEATLASLREDEREIAALLREWEPYARRINELQSTQKEFGNTMAALDGLLASGAPELVVGEQAVPAVHALTDFNKKTILGFLVVLLLGFGAIVALEMWRTRRAPAV